MRAMVRLANIYRDVGLEKEYLSCLNVAIEIYAGDIDVTFTLINKLIEKINETRNEVGQARVHLEDQGIDPLTISEDNLPVSEPARGDAMSYLEAAEDLESQYENCFRIMSIGCTAIPYNAELYYRTAMLQYIRAQEDGDNTKYRDTINFLKRAIASDSGHLESYHLIALAYEQLGDRDRAIRFWRLFEVVYEIAPEVAGEEFLTPQREALHLEALDHLENLGAGSEE